MLVVEERKLVCEGLFVITVSVVYCTDCPTTKLACARLADIGNQIEFDQNQIETQKVSLSMDHRHRACVCTVLVHKLPVPTIILQYRRTRVPPVFV
jgi:hypothetical protein